LPKKADGVLQREFDGQAPKFGAALSLARHEQDGGWHPFAKPHLRQDSPGLQQ
jgi:hypothetical protein